MCLHDYYYFVTVERNTKIILEMNETSDLWDINNLFPYWKCNLFINFSIFIHLFILDSVSTYYLDEFCSGDKYESLFRPFGGVMNRECTLHTNVFFLILSIQ